MKTIASVLFASILLLVGHAPSLAAQSDSVFTVNRAGENLLRLNQDGGFVVRGTVGVGDVPATGTGARMMWFPGRYAFRAGNLLGDGSNFWNLENVGNGSAAFGSNTLASGRNSFAAGNASRATGSESVALGAFANATGDSALAIHGTASAPRASALGAGTSATREGAISIGGSSLYPTVASGQDSFAAGIGSLATEWRSFAFGFRATASAAYSFALGNNVRARDTGSVVIGDYCEMDDRYPTNSRGGNSITMRACGGVYIYTMRNEMAGVQLPPGGSSWSYGSDRNIKTNFNAVDGEDILERLRLVPVSTWNYLSQDDSIRHLGPVAQDFYAAFEVGESDLLISSVDIGGVSLAAAQALTMRTDHLRLDVQHLREENADLRAEASVLRATVERIQEENAELRTRLERIERALAGDAPSLSAEVAEGPAESSSRM